MAERCTSAHCKQHTLGWGASFSMILMQLIAVGAGEYSRNPTLNFWLKCSKSFSVVLRQYIIVVFSLLLSDAKLLTTTNSGYQLTLCEVVQGKTAEVPVQTSGWNAPKRCTLLTEHRSAACEHSLWSKSCHKLIFKLNSDPKTLMSCGRRLSCNGLAIAACTKLEQTILFVHKQIIVVS